MEENSGRVFDSGYEEAGTGRQAHRGNMACDCNKVTCVLSI
jgi:hypothetical protein